MNIGTISIAYLRARPLNTLLILVLLALGSATISLLLLVSTQLQERMGRDARGIDLVVGAKGSPMQLILSSIYHLDIPTGNIALDEADALVEGRKQLIRKAIPLALGDSYRGFRIVGTNHDYPAHFGAQVAAGRLWERSMEAVIGAEVAARTGLGVGSSFTGVHGFEDGGGHHGEHPYPVVGVLARTGTVLDRLILTGVQSVWDVHATAHTAPGQKPVPLEREEKEITALLIQYASPLAVMQLPRFVNVQTDMQAASPAVESARLFTILGVGFDVIRAFAVVLIAAAALSVFVALYNALRERRYDLSIMRMLGASRRKLLALTLVEGMLLSLLGTVLGMLLGHAFTQVLGMMLSAGQQVEISGWYWVNEELWLLALALGVGMLSALVPAMMAYRTDIARSLAEG
jgi:putative ABC transport system permease protein